MRGARKAPEVRAMILELAIFQLVFVSAMGAIATWLYFESGRALSDAKSAEQKQREYLQVFENVEREWQARYGAK
jgi:hypothetical protein